MNIRKTGVLLALLCAAALLLVGCGRKGGVMDEITDGIDDITGGTTAAQSGGSHKKVALTLWGAADDQKLLRELCDSFEKQYKDSDVSVNIRVNGEDVACDEALKDIDAAADVFAIANDQLGALVNADAVYENTLHADEIRSERSESSVAAATIGDKLYGYPSSSETYFLFYDKNLLLDTDVKSLEAILNKGLPDGVCPFGFDFSDAYFSSSFFLTAGCKVYGENGQDPTSVTFNSDEGMEAARYIGTLKALGAEDMDGDVAGSRFKARKLAAYVSGSWKTAAYAEALGDDLGIAPLPTIHLGGEDRHMVSFAGGKMYVVKSTTAHPVEAMALAAFLTNEDSQLSRFRNRRLLPNHSALTDSSDIVSDEAAAAEVGQFAYTVPTPSITQISKYWDPVAAFTKDMFDGKIADKDIRGKLDTLVSDITAKKAE